MKRAPFLLFLSPLTLAVLTLLVVRPSAIEPPERVPGEALYREVMEQVQEAYVIPIDSERLAYAAVRGLVRELDPHSQVLTPEEFSAQRLQSAGEYAGIGVTVAILDGLPTLLEVLPEGPAARAGLLAGTRVVAADGLVFREGEVSLDAFSARLRGARGTTLILLVETEIGGLRREVKVERAVLPQPTAFASWLDQEEGIAYVCLSAFRSNSVEQFDQAIAGLGRSPEGGLILDLRHNRGGSLDAALKIADRFLGEGLLLVTVGRDRVDRYQSQDADTDLKVPLVLLVDERSASASEVLAGALQDRGRALLVGTRTYGKGVVQEIAPLQSRAGAGLKLTTRHYYTPAGRSIERRVALGNGAERLGGLAPDVLTTSTAKEREQSVLLRVRRRYSEKIQAALKARDGEAPEHKDQEIALALALLRGEKPKDRALAPTVQNR